MNEAVQTHVHHDDETMHVLRWNRVVLYDGLTGQPLVLYDAEGVVPKPRAAKKDYHRRYSAASRELQRTADAELATAVARGLPCPNLPATTQGADSLHAQEAAPVRRIASTTCGSTLSRQTAWRKALGKL